MLIHLTDVTPHPQGTLISARSAIGHLRALWRGNPPQAHTQHHVEWTVTTDAQWGTNLTPTTAPSPRIHTDTDTVTLRGLLRAQPDDIAILELGDTHLLLDLASQIPAEAWNTWAEFSAPPTAVELHPFEL